MTQQHEFERPTERPMFTAPRLALPTFQLTPRVELEPAPRSAPATTLPLPSLATRAHHVALPVQVVHAAPVAPPMYVPQPMVNAAPAVAPAPIAYAANPTQPAAINWARLNAPSIPTAERTLLQRVSPIHMGVLLILIVTALIVTSGPVAMKIPGANKLPAAVGGGGVVDGIAAAPRAGAAATAGATKKLPKRVVASKSITPRVMRVGSATLDPTIRHGGIPSPAAAARLSAKGGGAAAATAPAKITYDGIPSPAASEKLGPATLPFKPKDGVTLPRNFGDRDSNAVDAHYGTSGTLAMSAPVERPVMTPGDSALHSEAQAAQVDLSGSGAAPGASGPVQAF